jgi:hypothetical protein
LLWDGVELVLCDGDVITAPEWIGPPPGTQLGQLLGTIAGAEIG